jgi:hypothetical protein
MKHITSIDCRVVGPGGTSVDFYATKDGVKCIWTNENCPYTEAGEHDEALDGSNVDMILWETIERMLKSRPKVVDPTQIGIKQPKRKHRK